MLGQYRHRTLDQNTQAGEGNIRGGLYLLFDTALFVRKRLLAARCHSLQATLRSTIPAMPTIGTCALCHTELAELQVSHILPHFVGKYLREQSALKRFRHGTNPDKLEQDIEKMPLLCSRCEGLLSAKGEAPFAQEFFHPFQSSRQQLQRLDYQEWLLYFVISLSWRVVVTTIEEFRQDHPDLARWADIALEYWRNYLLGTSPDPGPYSHYMFFSGALPTSNVEIPGNLNAYASLCLDYSIAPISKSIYVYTKLPAVAFWSAIHPFEDEGWSDAQISEQGTLYAPQTASQNFADFMWYRSEVRSRLMNSISEDQREKTRNRILANQDAVIGSRAFQIFMTDHKELE